MKNNYSNKQSGFALSLFIFLTLFFMAGLAGAVIILAFSQKKISFNNIKSYQALCDAESGIEDILLRIKRTPNFPTSSYVLNIEEDTANVSISDAVGGTRTILSEGNSANRIKKVRVVYTIQTDSISFYYGAQVGEGGIAMGNNSIVQGNVFSNGNVIGAGNVSNSIIVAGTGNRIENVRVGEDATAHTCKNSIIGRTLTYVSGGSSTNCFAGIETKTRPNQIDPEPLPISQAQIDEWKADAAAGGILDADYTCPLGATCVLGPKQIGAPASPKNLVISNGAHLIITGSIYVTGTIFFNEESIIELDSSYGSLSGIILSDNTITIDNTVVLKGSGDGSYVLVLSNKNSPLGIGIDLGNNVDGGSIAGTGAIFYTNASIISVSNNAMAREITGYGIILSNNAVIQYEVGLENALFSSGQGGSWQIASWDEIQ